MAKATGKATPSDVGAVFASDPKTADAEAAMQALGLAEGATAAEPTINPDVPIPPKKNVFQLLHEMGLSADRTANQVFMGDAADFGEMLLRWHTNIEAVRNSPQWRKLGSTHRTALTAISVFCCDMLGLQHPSHYSTMNEYFADLDNQGGGKLFPVANDATPVGRYVRKHGYSAENLKTLFENMPR